VVNWFKGLKYRRSSSFIAAWTAIDRDEHARGMRRYWRVLRVRRLDRLEKYSHVGDVYIAMAVLMHPLVTPQMVNNVSRVDNVHVLSAVAYHPLLSRKTMNRLSKSYHLIVRATLVLRTDLSRKVMERLSCDSSGTVREAFIRNKSVDDDLRVLAVLSL
jgi:hypothetical protein